MTQALTIVYFAWVKERLGLSEEIIEKPDGMTTVRQLVDDLCERGETYSGVFDDLGKLRFALDQNFVQLDASLEDASELAIFPPVTGG